MNNYYKLNAYEQKKISNACYALNLTKDSLNDKQVNDLLEVIEKIYSDGFEDGKNEID